MTQQVEQVEPTDDLDPADMDELRQLRDAVFERLGTVDTPVLAALVEKWGSGGDEEPV